MSKFSDAPLAQLDRVLGYEPRGQGFESLVARQPRTRGGDTVSDFVRDGIFLSLSVSPSGSCVATSLISGETTSLSGVRIYFL